MDGLVSILAVVADSGITEDWLREVVAERGTVYDGLCEAFSAVVTDAALAAGVGALGWHGVGLAVVEGGAAPALEVGQRRQRREVDCAGQFDEWLATWATVALPGDEHHFVPTELLVESFKIWCRNADVRTARRDEFRKWIEARGFERVKRRFAPMYKNARWGYAGIALTEEALAAAGAGEEQIGLWLLDCAEVASPEEKDVFTPLVFLIRSYREWCEWMGVAQVSSEVFGNHLMARGFKGERRASPDDAHPKWGFVGFKLKEGDG